MKLTRVEILLPDMAVGKLERALVKLVPTHYLREDRVVWVAGGRQANYVRITFDVSDKALVEVVEEQLRAIPYIGLLWEITSYQVDIKGA